MCHNWRLFRSLVSFVPFQAARRLCFETRSCGFLEIQEGGVCGEAAGPGGGTCPALGGREQLASAGARQGHGLPEGGVGPQGPLVLQAWLPTCRYWFAFLGGALGRQTDLRPTIPLPLFREARVDCKTTGLMVDVNYFRPCVFSIADLFPLA